jgi:hypothetical protein
VILDFRFAIVGLNRRAKLNSHVGILEDSMPLPMVGFIAALLVVGSLAILAAIVDPHNAFIIENQKSKIKNV